MLAASAFGGNVFAVFYVLGTGCPWRALPKDLPPRSTVHDDFVRW